MQLTLPTFDETYKVDTIQDDGMYIGVVLLGANIVEETKWWYSNKNEALRAAKELYKYLF